MEVDILKQQTIANTLRQQAETANLLVTTLGFTPEAAIRAVTEEDLRILLGEEIPETT